MAAVSSGGRLVDSYYDLKPFGGMRIDKHEKLDPLIETARSYRALGFEEKLEKIKELAKGAFENAFDGLGSDETKNLCSQIIYKGGLRFSTALEHGYGCCRYQATLLFILGFEAELGDEHRLDSAEIVKNRLSTCFNTIVNDGETHHVNLFPETLNDKTQDYTQKNPEYYKNVTQVAENFLAYHKSLPGKVIVHEWWRPETLVTAVAPSEGEAGGASGGAGGAPAS